MRAHDHIAQQRTSGVDDDVVIAHEEGGALGDDVRAVGLHGFGGGDVDAGGG